MRGKQARVNMVTESNVSPIQCLRRPEMGTIPAWPKFGLNILWQENNVGNSETSFIAELSIFV